jgi:hypothetical protein
MSQIILRGRWCDIIVLDVHAPTEDKTYDMKDRFYKELEHIFDKFCKYHMKILLEFSSKVDTEDIFKPTVGNVSLHKIIIDNGVRILNFATSKNLSNVQCSQIITFINIFGHVMERLTIKLTIF